MINSARLRGLVLGDQLITLSPAVLLLNVAIEVHAQGVAEVDGLGAHQVFFLSREGVEELAAVRLGHLRSVLHEHLEKLNQGSNGRHHGRFTYLCLLLGARRIVLPRGPDYVVVHLAAGNVIVRVIAADGSVAAQVA